MPDRTPSGQPGLPRSVMQRHHDRAPAASQCSIQHLNIRRRKPTSHMAAVRTKLQHVAPATCQATNVGANQPIKFRRRQIGRDPSQVGPETCKAVRPNPHRDAGGNRGNRVCHPSRKWGRHELAETKRVIRQLLVLPPSQESAGVGRGQQPPAHARHDLAPQPSAIRQPGVQSRREPFRQGTVWPSSRCRCRTGCGHP